MVYSIQTEGRGRGVPCTVVVQDYCNRQCGPYMREGQYNDGWLVHKSAKVSEYLVKANGGFTDHDRGGRQKQSLEENTGGKGKTSGSRYNHF